MSILIKMEMPKECKDCPIYNGEYLRCNITKTEPWQGHEDDYVVPIPSDCPLIEVPPHGRLIDADAAMKAACEALCHLGVFCPDNLCKEVRETFDAVPTIIESEGEDD